MSDYFLKRQAQKAFGTREADPPKEQTPIAKRSEKRKVEQKEYVKIVKEMLKANPNCDIKEVGCQVKATGLHHKKKRSPSTFLDKDNLMRACDNCQLWVENNPLESIEKGYSISKHVKPSIILASMDEDLKAIVIEKG